MKRKQLFSTNKGTIQSHIPISITYNRSLPNIFNIIIKNWNFLQVSPILQKVFDNKPMITFKGNKDLGELTEGHTLQGGKGFKTHLQIINGKLKSYNTTNKSSLCCTQIVNTGAFKSCQTNRMFKIFHKLHCKSSFIIYLMECTLCKTQYVRKAETSFNIQLNKHRKDPNGNNLKAIPATIYF